MHLPSVKGVGPDIQTNGAVEMWSFSRSGGTLRVQAVAALQANASDFGIATIYYKGNGIEMFGDPTVDIRVPDIAIKVQPGECVVLPGPSAQNAGMCLSSSIGRRG